MTRAPASDRPWWAELFRPVDAASLVFFRVVFGLVIVWEVGRYFAFGWIARYWIEPGFNFKYWGFTWVEPWPGWGMYAHFVVLGLLGFCVAAGLFYRVASWLLFVAFTYVFLLEQTRYLNHFYLISLLCLIAAVVPADRAVSLDARRRPELRSDTVPVWSVWLLRFQVAIAYFYGGVAKLNADWLRGEPIRLWNGNGMDWLLAHPPDSFYHALGEWLSPIATTDPVVYFISYGGLIFDLAIAPALLWHRTRPYAYGFVLFFNIANALMFSIGVFPWLMLGASTIFFAPDWPRRVWARLRRRPPPQPKTAPADLRSSHPRLTVALLGVYVAFQVLMPLRHWLYPGNVSWTEQGHKYAWHMKLRSKRGSAIFIVRDRQTGQEWRVNPAHELAHWQARKIPGRPELILQYAQHLAALKRAEGYADVEVHADVMASLNGRRRVRLIDPTVDLSREHMSIWPQPWILPLDEPLRRRAATVSPHSE